MPETYPYPRKRVSASHIIYAYDGTLYDWAAEGRAVSWMMVQLRKEFIRVNPDAILSVIGGLPRGERDD